MSFLNYSAKELNLKILYCGPDSAGKKTSMERIYARIQPDLKSRWVESESSGQSLAFFDMVAGFLGTVRGYTIRLNLHRAPEAISDPREAKRLYSSADGVVFVADSRNARMDENVASLAALLENLGSHGVDPKSVPLVLQLNKRDLPNIASADEMKRSLAHNNSPAFEAVATAGSGVSDTLVSIAELTKTHVRGS